MEYGGDNLRNKVSRMNVNKIWKVIDYRSIDVVICIFVNLIEIWKLLFLNF